jgi:hypothetical protein
VYSLTKRQNDSGVAWYARLAFLGDSLMIFGSLMLAFAAPVAAVTVPTLRSEVTIAPNPKQKPPVAHG